MSDMSGHHHLNMSAVLIRGYLLYVLGAREFAIALCDAVLMYVMRSEYLRCTSKISTRMRTECLKRKRRRRGKLDLGMMTPTWGPGAANRCGWTATEHTGRQASLPGLEGAARGLCAGQDATWGSDGRVDMSVSWEGAGGRH